MSDHNHFIDKYSNDYLIIDFNNLFISSSIREEIYLLDFDNRQSIIDSFNTFLQLININFINIDRDLSTFSGGERSLIAFLLIICVIRIKKLNRVNILLIDIIQSLHENFKEKIIKVYQDICSTNKITLYINEELKIIEYYTCNRFS